jgi:hypothetical protein
LIPCLLIFPFIQCHHTRGRALCGGFTKPLFRESPAAQDDGAVVCANPDPLPSRNRATPTTIEKFHTFAGRKFVSFIVISISWFRMLSGEFL